MFLNSSCGLDEFYVLDDPTTVYTIVPDVTENISKYSDNYVSFATNEAGMIDYINNAESSFVFEGTEIYYKIYNNYYTYNSEKNTLYSLSTSDNYSSAATRMIETSGYHFLPLACENYDKSPMIPATGVNRRVYIRLTDYFENIDSSNSARIEIEGESITGSGNSSRPRRNGDLGELSFNFGREESNQNFNRRPVSGDADTKYDSSKGNNFFYVSLYAVAIGRDSNYARYYSNILHLGTITIDATSENN